MNSRGFTLVELILYVAIISVIGVVLVQWALSQVQGRHSMRVANLVQDNHLGIVDRVYDLVHQSTGIIIASSTFDSVQGKLVLGMPEVHNDPTVIELNPQNEIVLTQGQGGTEPLHDSNTKAVQFYVKDLSGGSTRKTIQVGIGLRSVNVQGGGYVQVVTSTISLR